MPKHSKFRGVGSTERDLHSNRLTRFDIIVTTGIFLLLIAVSLFSIFAVYSMLQSSKPASDEADTGQLMSHDVPELSLHTFVPVERAWTKLDGTSACVVDHYDIGHYGRAVSDNGLDMDDFDTDEGFQASITDESQFTQFLNDNPYISVVRTEPCGDVEAT